MIKVGNYITLKDDIPDAVKNENIIVPIKVKSIKKCPTKIEQRYNECIECPGYINNRECFGRTWGFIVRPINMDWDE